MLRKRKIISSIMVAIFAAQLSVVSPITTFAKETQASTESAIQSTQVSTPYEFTKIKYHNHGVTIYYPQIFNLADVNKQKTINNLIKANALRGLKYYSYLDKSQYTVDINYKIKLQSPDLLSIEYSGIGNAKHAAHPSNLYYTSNIDVNKASVVRLKDIVTINKKFVKLFISNKFKPLTKGLENAKTEFGKEDYLLKALSSSDLPVNVSPKLDYSTFSYLTKDYLVISIGVAHVEGDHAEYKIKFSDLKGYLNTNKSILNNLVSVQ